MLYHLLAPLSEGGDVFNLFRYITFRAGGAFMTALFIGFMFGRPIIEWLRRVQKKGQPIRGDGPQRHIVEKAGTPTMGGVLILFAMLSASFLWARLDNGFVWAVLLVTIGFGLIGFADDFLKVSRYSHRGVPGRVRLLAGFVIALLAGWFMSALQPEPLQYAIAMPILKEALIHAGVLYLPFAILVIAGSANAVNLTDGLDGLAIMPVMIAAGALGIIAYVVGRTDFTEYLGLQYIPGTGEIAIITAAVIGAGLGFLWYNAPPAMVFMGDTGSLALGGCLGAIAVAAKHEIVWAVIGGLFVLEAVSVMVQVASFKLTGKRVFRMAPIHHHFEQKGWAEPTVVIRFWIIAVILALIGLASLKVR
jgi:phospho-N-acetylmuramoyl-pentapeptide-transferase